MERRKGIIDMISGLPDEILLHILSFLPTNVSVRTSVLAKRWRFLWAHVPKLEFYNEYFWERRKKMQKKKKKTICLEIIERVISMHEAKTVNTFSISNVVGYEDRAEALISYAIERNVQNMYLEFNGLTEWAFPRLLLTCKTLVDLKLENFGMIPSKGELFLPSLKKLYLRNIDYEDKESLPHLLSGCPVLEELFVNDDFRGAGNNLNCFIVSSPTIKTLDLHLPRWHEEYDDEMLIIDVPALVYLNVYNCNLKYAKSLTKTMTSLIEAKIHINGFLHDCGIDCTKCVCSIAFLSSLCHVRCLKIPYMSVDISETSSMPKFVNLIKLNLDSIIDWKYVVKWLEVADNLEVLLFCSDWVPYTEPERVPTSMLSRLRTVTVTSFDYCSEGGFDMVRYILRNAQILERMEIHSDEEKLDACRRISLFERGSKSCELAFKFNRY